MRLTGRTRRAAALLNSSNDLAQGFDFALVACLLAVGFLE
jgi:hypothetical protein